MKPQFTRADSDTHFNLIILVRSSCSPAMQRTLLYQDVNRQLREIRLRIPRCVVHATWEDFSLRQPSHTTLNNDGKKGMKGHSRSDFRLLFDDVIM
jgi:hypothetical protein